MVQQQVKNGQILLAEPFMADPHFRRSAILLCEHGDEGSVGFIMNKPLDMRIDELVDPFQGFELFKGDLIEGSRKVTDGIYWGGDFEQLKALINSELIQPHDIRFFVGYSGWSERQLDDEMEIGFNAKYLADVLGNVDGEEVYFEFSTTNRAGIVKPSEEEDDERILMLVMPVMLNTYA